MTLLAGDSIPIEVLAALEFSSGAKDRLDVSSSKFELPALETGMSDILSTIPVAMYTGNLNGVSVRVNRRSSCI